MLTVGNGLFVVPENVLLTVTEYYSVPCYSSLIEACEEHACENLNLQEQTTLMHSAAQVD